MSKTSCPPAFRLLLVLLAIFTASPVLAQRIAPANDGTRTQVRQRGNRFDIEGGRRSRDGRNLFHSFERFGLSREQVANFQSDPAIRNILARIRGGDASLIDGILRVSGGNSNLYLINPAGIIFGRNARLDVPAAFTATTATGIGFANGWLSDIGRPDYAALVGEPIGFDFALTQSGAIVNSGNLAVTEGQSLTLLGGTVVNTGEIAAPGGNLTIAAVPGTHRVRLSQTGSLLSLELPTESSANAADASLPTSPLSLPSLLTGGEELQSATDLIVQPDGTVQLRGSGTVIPTQPGTTIVSGTLNAATSGTPANPEITVVGDRIALLDANLDASSATGGRIRVGGDLQGTGTLPQSQVVYVDPSSSLAANANSATAAGNGGQVIIWSEQGTQFFGNISATGGATGGNGGFAEVSSRGQLTFAGQTNLSAANGRLGTLLLDPTNILISDTAPATPGTDTALPDILAGEFAGDITINAATLTAQAADVILEATNNITVSPSIATLSFVPSSGGSIRFTADADRDRTGGFFSPTSTIFTNGRDLTISGATIATGDILTQSGFGEFVGASGDVTLTATGDITTGAISTAAGFGALAGDVTIASSQGSVTVETIDASSPFGEAGDVAIAGDRVQLTGTLPTEEGIAASIDVTGGLDGGVPGTIAIQFAGGAENRPFVVGTPGIAGTTLSGSAGSLTAGPGGTIASGNYTVAPAGNTLNPEPAIAIASVNAAPTITPGTTALTTLVGEPLSIPVSSFVAGVTDPNGDVTLLRLTSLPLEGTLTLNGVPILPGTLLAPTDTLVYTPPLDVPAILPVFEVVAVDLANGVPSLSSSAPIAVQVTIRNPPTPGPRPRPGPNPRPTPDPDPDPRPTPDPDPDPRPPDPRPSPSPLPPSPPEPLTSADPRVDTPPLTQPIPQVTLPPTLIDTDLPRLERQYSSDFEDYLGLPPQPIVTLDQAKELAQDIQQATGEQPAFIYISFVPEGINPLAIDPLAEESDQLDLVVVTAQGLIRRRVPEATRSALLKLAQDFRSEITNPRNLETTSYLADAQQLYQWLITPLADELKTQGITNLVFLPDMGLRSLPFAALHDGQQFLIEQYSVGLMPSLSLTDTRYVDVRRAQLLAMGISESTQGQNPLPVVPTELSTLVLRLWQGGRIVLNNDATIENFKQVRQTQPFGIIHLATHADFVPGPITNSYIQFWDERLLMDQVRQLRWNDPPVEMLVLSACRTALGNEQAELGFAGLAVQTGVKSAVASLWFVNDTATAALMTRFYDALTNAPIKAEALRQAQIAMVRGQVTIANGQIQGIPGIGSIPLPPGDNSFSGSLSHPYYWAAFTIIGNPW
ncbi:CHAT domain-containing protein [Leptolyngbya sp. GB1-A1]|uniref:CHAT domain-containing protein n=1 Tax=Leptolyngbya sp. GB1-A1 TaxID=2933908 RepID=UPI003298155B